jgi:carbamoyltransferase
MIVWGISANSHDAALAVFDKKLNSSSGYPLNLLFASQSERFSGVKNDPHLDHNLIAYAQKFGLPDQVIWYERPFKKTVRQLLAGQGWNNSENNIPNYLTKYGIHTPATSTEYVDHHLSHAAGGYYTSGYDQATVICIDSIGEVETLTIWDASKRNGLKRKYSQRYPHSVGLWYSAMTQRIGLKPNEDEYILMGMAAYGNPDRFYRDMVNDFIKKWPDHNNPGVKFKKNLHRGCKDWKPHLTSEQDMFDIAAATQKLYEEIFEYIVQSACMISPQTNLVLTGGCALNCSANHIAKKYYKNVWIMPNPGDSGSAIGAVLAHYQQPIEWKGPFLGYNIEGTYPVEKIINELSTTGICGVASGRSEFGPRSLGNRSLVADPRGRDIKDRVNHIKQRQEFRPFAPAILEEHAQDFFTGSCGPYMQFTARCKYPELYPAIVHVDGTSRVQTVGKNDNRGFRKLLERWYAVTGCPMLLNTSLNIKGQPIVNSWQDAQEFQKHYGVKVC